MNNEIVSVSEAPSPSSVNATGRWEFMRLVVAAILFLAAASKAWNVVETLQGDGLLSERWLLFSVIFWEAALALFLVVGDSVRSWKLATMTFVSFAAAASYAIVTGQSCNCISQLIPTEAMLTLDVSVIAALAFCRPRETSMLFWGNCVSVPLAVAAGTIAVAAAIAVEHQTDSTDPLEYILADMLLDHTWPLGSSFGDELSELEKGQWLVIIGRHDCDHCRELVTRFFSDPSWHREGERTAFFLAGSDQWSYQLDRVSFDDASDGTISWKDGEPFVASPAIFLLSDGVVVDASDGEQSDEFLDNMLSQ